MMLGTIVVHPGPDCPHNGTALLVVRRHSQDDALHQKVFRVSDVPDLPQPMSLT